MDITVPTDKNMTFALLFAARNSIPEENIGRHRAAVTAALVRQGIDAICLEKPLTRNGGVETIPEANNYARFLRDNEGVYDGVIVCVMNFTEESATMIALHDCHTPILLYAVADKLEEMDVVNRKDAFCGRLALMAAMKQFGTRYTAYTPHVCLPDSSEFAANIRDFSAVCRVVNGMKRCRLGLIGARPVSFKTVRTDEMTLQEYGITTEAFDLSELLYRYSKISAVSPEVAAKRGALNDYADFSQVPPEKFDIIARWSVTIDSIINDYALDAVAIRCWNEPQQHLGISVCAIVSELNARGYSASCEVDAMNALSIHALKLATGNPGTMLDWNNNYLNERDMCIISHCGNVPPCYMRTKSLVHEHTKFKIRLGEGCNWGAINGYIKPMHITFASARTGSGKVWFYCGEADVTDLDISTGFYGCGGVIKVPKLQHNLLKIGKDGFRHHVTFSCGSATETLREAFETYLGYDLYIWEK